MVHRRQASVKRQSEHAWAHVLCGMQHWWPSHRYRSTTCVEVAALPCSRLPDRCIGSNGFIGCSGSIGCIWWRACSRLPPFSRASVSRRSSRVTYSSCRNATPFVFKISPSRASNANVSSMVAPSALASPEFVSPMPSASALQRTRRSACDA